ncbi:MAG: hypothetical protein U0Q16_03565 [Bryobacteraceae bacterium]
MEQRLKDLMQELGNAINESLSDSDRIAAAIGDIRRSGYDVFLVLEATIGFNKRDDDSSPVREPEELAQDPREFHWTSQDQKFLKALKIAVDRES